MSDSGRPIRFLGVVLGGWIAVRIVLLWPQHATMLPAQRKAVAIVPVEPLSPIFHLAASRHARPARAPRFARAAMHLAHALPDLAPAAPFVTPAPVVAARQSFTVANLAKPPATSRWSVSVWTMLRDGHGIGAALSGSQLGGAQAGARIAYALGDASRWSLVGRFATPLGSRGREAALGLEWRPPRLPLRIIAERRFQLDGGRGGTGLGIVGGINPTGLARGIVIEGYGQAGAIYRQDVEVYVDGAVRISHPIALALRPTLGVGAWGGAQRGASRLDIGPSLGLAVPAGRHALRLSLDWRQRVAGGARPGSGPALTLGADF
ncbi:hypothetical protein BH09PSE4_BH09PSE4_21980 [soil metagenome]